MRRAHSCWWLSKTGLLAHSELQTRLPTKDGVAAPLADPLLPPQEPGTPQVLQPSHLTLSWISQAQRGCPAEQGTDGQPGPCPEHGGAPAPTFTGGAAEHLGTEPGEERGAPGRFSAGQGKAPGCWGRGTLEASLRKLLSCLKRLFPYWHSGSTTQPVCWALGSVLEPSRSPLWGADPAPWLL